jgi:phosphoribosylaminoimidazole-succinocarboxamide synthase
MQKQKELYAGKAKSVFTTEDPNKFILVFRDDTSAFDGERVEKLNRKGMVNNKFNAFIMQKASTHISKHCYQTLNVLLKT